MQKVYPAYEAKTRFSEILRKVRGGQTVWVSYHGKTVAELRPVAPASSLDERLERLEAEGILVGSSDPSPAGLRPVARRPGGLQRFLDSRD